MKIKKIPCMVLHGARGRQDEEAIGPFAEGPEVILF